MFSEHVFQVSVVFPSWIVKQESRCSNLNLQSLFLTDKSNGRILRNWYGSVFHVPIIIPSRQAQQEDTIWFSQSQETNKGIIIPDRWILIIPTKGRHYSFLPKPNTRISLFLPGKPKPDRRIFCMDFPHGRGMKAAHLGDKGL